MERLFAVVLTILCAATVVGAGEKITPETLDDIAETMRPSLVAVEVFLRYDKGEPPQTVRGQHYANLVKEERPLRIPGFLLAERTVALDDPLLHPRFVDRIEVAYEGARSKAAPAAWFTEGGVMLLELEKPLPGTRPIEFHGDATGPWFSVTFGVNYGRRWVGVHPVPTGPVWHEVGGPAFRPASGVIVDAAGRAAGMSPVERLYLDGSWRGSPLAREHITAGDLEHLLSDLERRAAYGIVRVGLDFRSPRRGAEEGGMFYRSSGDGVTRLDVPGVRLPEDMVLVLADLAPATTARLEQITVNLPDREPIAATFEFSFKRLGAFVARLPEGLPPALPVDRAGALEREHRLIFANQVLIRGETRLSRIQPAVYSRVRVGWREQLHPGLSGDSVYLFTRNGDLLSIPLGDRMNRTPDQGGYSPGTRGSFAVAHLLQMIADRAEHEDPSNVPRIEEEENRVAWLGVVLQPLDKDLARINKVSEQTRDGRCGGLVSYVYEGSPAAKAGIEVGAILLRVHSLDHPEPMDVQGMSLPFGMPDMSDLPPEFRSQFFERMGRTPWPSVENPLTKMLTGLGIGSEYELEYVQDGKLQRRKFTAELAPHHYGSARRFKSEKLGLTVRNLTFEVRRYFQLGEDEPGVIVSHLEAGERAAVAGVETYQIVTHVDDEPVRTVEDFERLAEAPGEHRLVLRKRTQTKTVKIEVPE